MKKLIILLIGTVIIGQKAMPLDNGLAQTPPMGWNSWNPFELNIDEGIIRSAADAIGRSGMKDAGYEYVIVDAGWKAKARDADGNLMADTAKFPSGMKSLADYIHGKGLKFGIYTDAGVEDCVSGAPGSKGFEEKDAATFAAWGVDYLKEDWCHTEGMNAQDAYSKMSKAILATGRPMVFSMCEWGDSKPWEWAAPVANLWRTTGDNKDCWDCGREAANKPGGYPRGWILILDAQLPLQKYAGPGHWNDPDMLEVGKPGLGVEQSRAHFSLWAILAAPLIAGNDVRNMPQDIANILLNKEVIAVDQDQTGAEGTRVRVQGETEVWARTLADKSHAIVLFNRSSTAAKVIVQWPDVGMKETDSLAVRDLWKHEDLGRMKNGYSAQVPSHGVVMIKVSSSPRAK